VLLVKPQFEVAASDTDRGVVVSQEIRARALAQAVDAVRRAGLRVVGTTESPLRGAEGNVEYLLAACAQD
jgi:23S rRNA (cytidine1920-2'-O)/16S rRNA (cytidine1409-2'-O)-methyltransferase